MNRNPVAGAETSQTVTQHLIDEIERRVSFYEAQAQEKIYGRYLAQVEKLATRTKGKDPALADFFRNTVQPGSILSATSTIRFYLRIGQIVDAKMALDLLGKRLQFVEQYLTQPFFRKGLQFSGGYDSRLDVLARAIVTALRQLGREASAREVLAHIGATPGVEIDSDETVLWRDARGREKTTTFKRFRDRISERKRKLFPQPRKKI